MLRRLSGAKSREINAEMQLKTPKMRFRHFRNTLYTYFPEIEGYVGNWQSGDYKLEIVHMLDDYNLLNCIVTRMDDDHNGVRWIYDACSYDDVGNALASMEIGMKFTIVLDDSGELVSNEEIFTDGAAAFKLNDDGTLTWTDFKQAPGEGGIVFERTDG